MVAAMRARVEETNACALPGCAIKYETFIPAMWQAVARGFVSHDAACFVGDGLRHGFTAGVDVPALARMGNRWFANYNTAVGARVAVRQAIMKRVDRGKTFSLGVWSSQLAGQLRDTFTNTFIAPLGAVEKALEKGVYRPTTDHSRTGLNANTDLSFLRHSLQTYDEIAYFLQTDYFMRMSDVEDAFPMLPLHPDVWPYFMYRFYLDDTSDTEGLFLNTFAGHKPVCSDGHPLTRLVWDLYCDARLTRRLYCDAAFFSQPRQIPKVRGIFAWHLDETVARTARGRWVCPSS